MNDNTTLFVKYRDNWADEMDINGFALVTNRNWQILLDKFRVFIGARIGWEFGIGTNEEIEYRSYDHWFSKFTIVELSDDEAVTMIKICKRAGMSTGNDPELIIEEGFFPLPYDWEDVENEDEDAEDDEETEDVL